MEINKIDYVRRCAELEKKLEAANKATQVFREQLQALKADKDKEKREIDKHICECTALNKENEKLKSKILEYSSLLKKRNEIETQIKCFCFE